MWKNKVVIITGSSMGIGFALAKELALKGAKVVINGSNVSRLNSAHEQLRDLELNATAIVCDVTNYESCGNLIEKTLELHGKIDALINNAGISSEGALLDSHQEVHKRILDVNVNGAFNMTKAALPHLKKQGGNVLFIGSVAGIRGLGDYAAYSSSKMALTGLAESLKIELHNTNIRVGIAYLSFIENSNTKTILGTNNEWIPQPERNNVTKMSQETLSKKLIVMMERNTFKKVFSSLGFFTILINRFSPSLLQSILLRIYKKRKQ
jgi:NAD(P)-dependent dehydrogenase (short-subunit alcohol dehydrogenase family)